MSRSLIVLPDDSARPILDAINSAEKSIRVKMFVFSDPELLKAIVAAHHRSVKVQIMLNPARRDGKEENQESRQLRSEGLRFLRMTRGRKTHHSPLHLIDLHCRAA
jgi:cardiolipin synthase